MGSGPTFNPTDFDTTIQNQIDGIGNMYRGTQLGEPGVKLTKGQIYAVENSQRKIDFQFNPSEISEDVKTNWDEQNPIQSEQQLFQHINFGGRTINFDLFFHGLEAPNGFGSSVKAPGADASAAGRLVARAEEGLIAFAAKRIPFAEGIGTATGILFNKIFPPTTFNQKQNSRQIEQDLKFFRRLMHGSGNKTPPKLIFNWRNYSDAEWILTEYKVKTNMWTKNQIPLMTTVSITLKEAKIPTYLKQPEKF